MATAGVPLWSTTAASNSTADPAVNWAEGQAPSSVNDSARAMMASVAKWRNDLYGITTGGSSTAYTVATGATYASTAVMSGAVFVIIPHATNGASPTLAVDGLTAYAINVSTGAAVPTGAMILGTPYFVKYVHASTEFILLGNLASFAAGNGAVGAPSFTFAGDLDTGIYHIGANNIGVTANGAIVLNISTTGLSVTGTLTTTSTIFLGHASDTPLTRSAAGVMAVAGVPLYPGIPITDKSADYTLVLGDAQTAICHAAADTNNRTFTIPANASVAYPNGTCITFINEVNTVTIAITSDTMVLAGTGSTGSRTLASNGVATAIKRSATRWYISGTGLT